MTIDPLLPAAQRTEASAAAARLAPWRLVAGGLLALGGMALGWQGGAPGAVGVLAAAGLAGWLQRPTGAAQRAAKPLAQPAAMPALATPSAVPPVGGGRLGAEVMVQQVVPVWSRQMEITRAAAMDGLGRLLDIFAQLSGALGALADKLAHNPLSVQVGAVEAALAEQAPARAALSALLATSERALAQRDAALQALHRCTEGLQALRHLGRQAREVAKHTRLVAFNAAIESNRGLQASGSGSPAVALETRMLADRMAEVGAQVERAVSQLEQAVQAERLHSAVGASTAEELQLELDVRAREALACLVGGLGSAVQNSGEVLQASQALRQQLDEAFVNFQFGDRLSQMLTIVGTDMENFARWVNANPYATQSDAAEWLANLETSYTMEEQRSQHHGNVHVNRGSEVEFF